MTAIPAQIVLDGDSISASWGASPGRGLDNLIAQAISFPARISTVAVGGRPVYECMEKYQTTVGPFRERDAPLAVIAFHAGDNDLRLGKTAEETYAAFSAYVKAAHADGWAIIVTTELQIYRSPPEFQAELRRYNALLLRNTAGVDIVIDLDLQPSLVDRAARSNRNLFRDDEVHPADGGYALIAAMICAAIERFWTCTRRPQRS